MKKLFYAFICMMACLIFNSQLSAQTKPYRNDTIYADQEVSGPKVSMEINPQLFPKTQNGMFISDNPRAMIMPMVMRNNFDSLEQKKLLDETEKELDMNIIKKGSFTKKGKTVYYLIGTTKDKTRDIIMEVYFVKGQADNTIMITGFYDSNAKKAYNKQIRNAALTARIENLPAK